MAVDHHFGELADPLASDGKLRAGVAEAVEAVPGFEVQAGLLKNQAVAWRTVGGRGAVGAGSPARQGRRRCRTW
ncbi:hypothetical protein [Actinomadura rifamycini]|uniref:hypothetical protein n=1 Tax=Actinomadura rifamycini TaxID=31962 RepID=UPI0012F73A8A|nr:hypothetical protein [Actinomadura rifamycini]